MATSFWWLLLCVQMGGGLRGAVSAFPAMQLLGDASMVNGSIQLTSNRYSSYGRALWIQRVALCNGASPLSFTTAFAFHITGVTPASRADGLAFLLAPDLSDPGRASFGRWLGLSNASSSGHESNHLLAIEFDTYMNLANQWGYQFNDPDNNHIGLNVNGITSVVVNSVHPQDVDWHGGKDVNVWIDYDGPSHLLNVYVSYSAAQPNVPSLSWKIDICKYVNKYGYVGFSAGSGTSNMDVHSIISWSYFAGSGTSNMDIHSIIS